MFIVSKAAPKISQLNDRVEKGFSQIELQLTKEFFSCRDISAYYCVLSKNWDIVHVHMPFIPGESDLPIEFISNPKFKPVFLNVCKLSQKCAEYYNHDINIIVHTNIPLATMKHMPDTLNGIASLFQYTLNRFPNIHFSIENGALYSTRNGDIRINPSSFDDNVKWANYFNNKFKTTKFNTTLDICHMLMTIRGLGNIVNHPEMAYLEKTINWYFKQNSSLIKNIHLNNMREHGLKKDHSETFSYSHCRDVEILNTVFELCKQYDFDCNLTLEVEESDYNNAIKAQELKNLLEQQYSQFIKLPL